MDREKSQAQSIDLTRLLTSFTYLGAFLAPFLLGGPQTLVGTVVNAFLILAVVLTGKFKKVLPLTSVSVAEC